MSGVTLPARLLNCCVSLFLSTYSGMTVTVNVIGSAASCWMVADVPDTLGNGPAIAFSESLLSVVQDTSYDVACSTDQEVACLGRR